LEDFSRTDIWHKNGGNDGGKGTGDSKMSWHPVELFDVDASVSLTGAKQKPEIWQDSNHCGRPGVFPGPDLLLSSLSSSMLRLAPGACQQHAMGPPVACFWHLPS